MCEFCPAVAGSCSVCDRFTPVEDEMKPNEFLKMTPDEARDLVALLRADAGAFERAHKDNCKLIDQLQGENRTSSDSIVALNRIADEIVRWFKLEAADEPIPF
jgi:hypothetical protein